MFEDDEEKIAEEVDGPTGEGRGNFPCFTSGGEILDKEFHKCAHDEGKYEGDKVSTKECDDYHCR